MVSPFHGSLGYTHLCGARWVSHKYLYFAVIVPLDDTSPYRIRLATSQCNPQALVRLAATLSAPKKV